MKSAKGHWLDDDALRAAYEFLVRAAFHDCVLPDKVTLRLRRKKGCDGLFYYSTNTLQVCPDLTPLQTLRVLAHEMVHMVLWLQGEAERRYHDANFQALAKIICRRMGWSTRDF